MQRNYNEGTDYNQLEIELEIENKKHKIDDLDNSIQDEDNSAKDSVYLPIEPIDFSRDFYFINCPYCKMNCRTRVIRKSGSFLYISSLASCLLVPPLCFLPFCFKRCYDKVHYCSICNEKIGYHKVF